MEDKKKIYCDVLVIGGGETGIRSAVEAKRKGADNVLLVTKGRYGSAGVMFSDITYGWDMQAATGQNDKSDGMPQHFSDILKAAQGTCNEKLAEILTQEAPARVEDLKTLFGLEIYRNEEGVPRQVYGCFSSKNRSYQFIHPHEIKQKVANGLEKFAINMLDGIMIIELLVNNNQCFGAIGLDTEGQKYIFISKAVILACGGATGMYKHNFACPGMSGDGYSLALNAGCSLVNMEFMQFGLGILEPKYRALFLDRLMFLNPDVKFTHDHNFPCTIEEMLLEHSKHFPFSTIDQSYHFDVAVLEETIRNEEKGVAVDLSVIPIEELQKIPVWDLYYHYFDEDMNPYDNKLYITVFAHACNGGVLIDENASTGIKGLFAAGEMVAGPHGANRLGGNMHAACQVFGTRAGKNAAELACSSDFEIYEFEEETVCDRCNLTGGDYLAAKSRIGDVLWQYVSVARNEEGMKKAIDVIDSAAKLIELGKPDDQFLWDYYELISTVNSSRAIVSSALERTETRGSHNRTDYPTMDEKAYIIKCYLADGEMMIERCENYPLVNEKQ